VLDEKITIYILLGALLIISGVWFAENGSKLTGKERVK
jgi:drug/metabolite transporter (DMT)-like permease